MNLYRQVTGHGPTDSGIVVLGEAPGIEEVKQNTPFVGMAGRTLRRKIKNVGLDPEHIRYENVIEYQIPNNDINPYYFDHKKFRPNDELRAWHEDCIKRLVDLKPKVVIAAGDTALRALTFPQHWPISKSHCYVLKNHKLNNGIPIIPIYHPQFVNYSPEFGIWLEVGIAKAQELVEEKDYVPSESGFITLPSFEQVMKFIELADKYDHISVDIEKERKDHKMTDLGLAVDQETAISIPWSGWKDDEFAEIKSHIAKLLASDKIKIMQNFCFDSMMLWREGLPVSGPFVDTMELSVILNPQLKKSLGDLGRIYLYIEPWKHKGSWHTKGITTKDFAMYNCRDAAYTYQIFTKMLDQLKTEGFGEYYKKYREPLYDKILELCIKGWNIDLEALKKLQDELTEEVNSIKQGMEREASGLLPKGKKKKKKRDVDNDIETDIVKTADEWKAKTKEIKSLKTKYTRNKDTGRLWKKAFVDVYKEYEREFNPASPVQIKDILKEKGIILPKKSVKRDDGTRESSETTDDKALAKLVRKYPDDRFLKLLRWYRKKENLLSTYAKVKLDPDNKMRFRINISGTDTGRFSSSQTPWDTGLNSQNIPKEFRHVVVPDPGFKLVQVDLKQAELWMVAWLSKDTRLIKMLENNEDVHQLMADVVRSETGIEATRHVGKTINHATSYLMGSQRFADLLLSKNDIVVTLRQAREIINLRFREFPGIPKWQREMEQILNRNRSIRTPFGRVQTFFGRLDRDLVAKALNFVPQSSVADIINSAWLKLNLGEGRVIQQGHDSLLMQIKENEIEKYIPHIHEVFDSVKFKLNDNVCCIPHEIETGYNWKEMVSYNE